MNLRLQGVIAFNLGQRLAKEADRLARADHEAHRSGQTYQDLGPRRSLRRRLIRVLQLGDRSAAVACVAMPIGTVEDAPARVLAITSRCKPDSKLKKLGRGSCRSP